METLSGANTIHHIYAPYTIKNTLLQKQIQTSEKASTSTQNASISNNEKIKNCHIRKEHPTEDPE